MSNNGGMKILLIYYDEYDGLLHIDDECVLIFLRLY